MPDFLPISFLKDAERMKCICPPGLREPSVTGYHHPQPAFCFVFPARNRKTRFPAFSIPNGLVLRGKTSPQNPPQGYTEGKSNKSWSIPSPNIPLAGSRELRQFGALISCLLGRKERKNYEAAGPESQNLPCWCYSLLGVHLLQKDKPATAR